MDRILVVEDHEENLALIRYLLRHGGFECLEARTGVEAVQMAREHRPDLILMDLQMPVLDGFGALAVIRADPDIGDSRVVAVTAYSMAGDRERALEHSFDGYLTKPIDPFTFNQEIGAFLAG